MLSHDKLTVKAGEAIQNAAAEARQRGNAEIHGVHLLDALLRQEEGIVVPILQKLEIPVSRVESQTRQAMDRMARVEGGADPRIARDLNRALDAAEKESRKLDDQYVSTEHLLLGLTTEKDDAGRILRESGADPDRVREALEAVRGPHRVLDQNPEDKVQALARYSRDLTDMARQGKLDPVIGRDDEIRRVIKVLARRTKNNPVLIGEPGVGKTAIVEGLAQRIVHGDVPSSLADKKLVALDISAMLAGAKYRGEFEERLKAVLKEITESDGRYVVFLDELHTMVGAGAAEGAVDAGNMLKPALARGELRMVGATTLDEYRKHIEKDPALERRFQPVYVAPPSVDDAIAILRGLKERYEVHHGVRITDDALVAAVKLSDRYIGGRFLPDKAIDLMDEAGSRLRIEIDSMPQEIDEVERRITQLEIEKSALSKEEERSAVERREAIEEELGQLRERSSGMKARWQSEKEAIQRLQGLKEKVDELRVEAERATRTGDLGRAAEIQYSEIPGTEQAIEVADARLQELQAGGSFLKEEVDADDIAAVVGEWTGIPVSRLLESERARLSHLEDLLGERVIGQREAVEAVSNAVRRARAGLQDPDRPVGSFIFLGPTGVGKTETARALAEFLFDDERAMVRIDMSEYMEKHAVARLIGAPPGYVGFEEGGQLTEAVRRRPHSVILFDEIEKAHPEVFNVFLQILDDGRLTDSQGRTVDFRNAVIIMTSNIGSQYILEAFGSGREGEVEETVRREMQRHFRPEFLNRVDDIIVFQPLGQEDLARIVALQLQRVDGLAADLGYRLVVTSSAQELLAREGYDPAFGARPLKRVIQRRVQDPLALLLLEQDVPEGSVITVDVDPAGEELVFTPRSAVVAAPAPGDARAPEEVAGRG
ncbi:MAG TPA: ATP-dependent chaperone ClpB [Longimicrobiales bacterium]|nr:ATP-dependent chaperone ClpB [Longimicrobiales bacterium]